MWFGQSRLDVDLEGAHTAQEVYDRIRARAAELTPGAWVTCSGGTSPWTCILTADTSDAGSLEVAAAD